MKTELLAAIAGIQSSLDTTSALVNALPADPAPLPTVPTNLAVVYTYPIGGPLAMGLGWDDITSPFSPVLEIKSAPGNPNGPQDWTDCGATDNGLGEHNERFTYILQNPAGQVLLFRLSSRNMDSITSDPMEITVNADDYPQI